jgi:hypothetical protein
MKMNEMANGQYEEKMKMWMREISWKLKEMKWENNELM